MRISNFRKLLYLIYFCGIVSALSFTGCKNDPLTLALTDVEPFPYLYTLFFKPHFSVISTSPANGASDVSVSTTIAVTFNHAANTATITTNTTDNSCSGSLQVSYNDFVSCVPMTAPPVASNADRTFTITPSASLYTCSNYKIRVTTAAQDSSGNPLPVEYSQASGFDMESSTGWVEDAGNPIIVGGNTFGTDRAYYPYVLKVGNVYHIWYGDGSNTRHATSTYPDFQDVTFPASAVSGLSSAYKPYHPRVKYNASGWTVGGTFYSGPFLMYYTNSADWTSAPRNAHSADGQTWIDIGACTGISQSSGDSIYSFDILYEGGTDWKGYRDDGGGNILYFTSTDGVDWTLGSSAILNTYNTTWENSTWKNISPSIYKIGSTYIIFFSGGLTNNDQGFGYATSTDGVSFTKSADNPIFSIADGVAWRDIRTYTTSIIQQGQGWYVYYTGRTDTPSVSYSIGLARKCGDLY